MKPITLNFVLQSVGGSFSGDPSLLKKTIRALSIDSRSIGPGELFVPIVGERFDGHDFLDEAYQKGALAALSNRMADTRLPLILVEDTTRAFQRLAQAYRDCFPGVPFVGVTGSVGKTTTKELIYSVLSTRYLTLKNKGNLNNQTGVPLTLFALEDTHEAAVIEMGMNHFGEIDALARIVKPDICVLTNIGDCHIEFLGSREGILKAKSEMFAYMNPEGHILVNGDDTLLYPLKRRYERVLTYGIDPKNDIWASDIQDLGLMGSQFTAHFEGRTLSLFVPAPGLYMIRNALCALATGRLLGVDAESIRQGLRAFVSTAGRMHILRARTLTVLNDAYNANPTSMAASIDVATAVEGRSVLILGDMFELGKEEHLYHYETGSYAVQKGAALILCVGKLSHSIFAGVQDAGGAALHFEGLAALREALPDLLLPGDTVLVKASNSMKLGSVVDFIMKNF